MASENPDQKQLWDEIKSRAINFMLDLFKQYPELEHSEMAGPLGGCLIGAGINLLVTDGFPDTKILGMARDICNELRAAQPLSTAPSTNPITKN